VSSLDAFAENLKVWLRLYHQKEDRWLKHAAMVRVLEVFERFGEASGGEVDGLLAPVMQEYQRGLVDLINGRNPEIFRAAPRDGKRPPKADDIQPQVHAALYANRRMQVPGIDKKKAIREAAEKFHFKPQSVRYWLRQATDGNAPWAALFDFDRRVLTAKYPNLPERQAAALLKAHRQGVKKV
jgi:hypothetical protein